MIERLKCKFYDIKTRVREYTENNRLLSCASLIILGLAIIFSIFNIIENFGELDSDNTIIRIIAEDYSVLNFLLDFIILSLIFGGLLIVSNLIIYTYFLSFIGVYFFAYTYISRYMASIFVDGSVGIISFVLYFVPLFIFIYGNYFYTLSKLEDITGVLQNNRHFINLYCHKSCFLKIICKSKLKNLIAVSVSLMIAYCLILLF